MRGEVMNKQYVKTRCNNCMTYFDYDDENIQEECPFCKTDEFLTDLTEEDMKYLEEHNLL